MIADIHHRMCCYFITNPKWEVKIDERFMTVVAEREENMQSNLLYTCTFLHISFITTIVHALKMHLIPHMYV
jgi:hypothetical protein